MKNLLKVLCFLIGILPSILLAQSWIDPNNPPKTFQEYQASFKQFRQKYDLRKTRGWKPYQRWEYFWEPRISSAGTLSNPMQLYSEWRSYETLHPRTHKTQAAMWEPLGPEGRVPQSGAGRVNCIAFHPTDNNTWYIGTPAGGVWKTTNGGNSWIPLTDGIPSIGIADIIIDHSDPEHLFIATGDPDGNDTYSVGVMESFDGGGSWSITGLNFQVYQTRHVYRLLMHPNNPAILIASTSNGVFRSTNAGVSWTQTYFGQLRDLEINPANPDIIYGSGSSNFARSTDNGVTWQGITNQITTSGVNRIAIAVTPANPNIVYALLSKSGTNGFAGLWRSLDNGITWSERSNTPNLLGWEYDGSDNTGQGWYDLALAASSVDADMVFVGGVNIWKSGDGGSTWSLSAFWMNDIHADQHTLIFQPNSNTLFAGNDGGIYYTTDLGYLWADANNDIQIMQFYKISVAASNSYIAIGGAQDNGTNVYKNGYWESALGGDGMDCHIDPVNSGIMYGSLYYGAISRSTNFGQSWTNISAASNGAWVTPFAINPTQTNTLYAGYDEIYKTTNRGNSWAKKTNGISSGNLFRHLTVAPSDGNFIYAATYSTLYTSQDGGNSWVDLSNNLPAGQDISGIAIHPDDPMVLMITYSGYDPNAKVYRSYDGGYVWENISGTLPNVPINCSIYEKTDIEAMYIGTDLGVFYRNSLLSDWMPFNDGLPNTIVNDLEINYLSNKIYAGTYGRGLWTSPLFAGDYECFSRENFSAGAPQLILDSRNTFISGNNLDGDVMKAEFFSVNKKDLLKTGSITFKYATQANPNTMVDIFAFANDGINGTPYSILGKTSVSLSRILNDISLNQSTIIDFPLAIEVKTTGFYIAVKLPDQAGDTVAIGIGTPKSNNTAWSLLSNGTWESYDSPRWSRASAHHILLLSISSAIAANFNTSVDTIAANTVPVRFSDMSTSGTFRWAWNFGDNTTSSQPNPNHTYTTSGVYVVTLTISNGLCSDTISKQIVVLPTGRESLIDKNITIFPNPNAGQFELNCTNFDLPLANLKIFDTQGKMLHQEQISTRFPNYISTELSNGVYHLEIQSGARRYAQRIVIYH
ncbi:MAG: T9SS type A sorting domain-containing protein [Bacteroidia bacterium]|nr:T9SS type A sorting domain-containing protein [Bacteroidia bacterium]